MSHVYVYEEVYAQEMCELRPCLISSIFFIRLVDIFDDIYTLWKTFLEKNVVKVSFCDVVFSYLL